MIFIGTFLAAYILFNMFEFERTGKNKVLTFLKKTHLDIIAYFVGAISLFIYSNSMIEVSINIRIISGYIFQYCLLIILFKVLYSSKNKNARGESPLAKFLSFIFVCLASDP